MPTILFADGKFADLAKIVATSMGSPALPIVKVPSPIGVLGEKNKQSAEAAIEGVISALTKVPKQVEDKGKPVEEIITITGQDYVEAVENTNELFMERKWGDGLPLIPPTRAAVEKMLDGTSHSSSEVVGILEQRKGIATVKSVAINTVMAGCRPEYLPVVLAAVQAVTDPLYNLYGVQATTSVAIPFLIVNGPIRHELKINSGMGSWGPGHRANATIGRAFNLVMMTVGGRIETSMSSFSDPGRYSWCAGENEEDLPLGWVPMHVEKGYKPEQNTITVMNVHWRIPILGYIIPTNDDEATELISNVIKRQEPHWYGEGLLVLLPEIAAQLARKAPTKYEFKKIMLETTKVPWRNLKLTQVARIGDFPPKGVEIPSDDTMLSPMMSKPEDLNVMVTGGAGKGSFFLYPWVRTHTITSSIDAWR